MQEPLVSVIVPVYNVELYLRDCLDSILAQTYRNTEIIVVNDGSTDNSQSILDEYARKDNRILLASKDNGGLSSARNTGLDRAKGTYYCFVDSDDVISPNFVQYLLDACNQTNCLLALGKIVRFEKMTELNGISNSEMTICTESTETMLKRQYIAGSHAMAAVSSCNKLYHKSLWANIRFPENRIYEDNFVMFRLYLISNIVAVIDYPVYYYRRRPESITSLSFGNELDTQLDALHLQENFFKEKKIYDKFQYDINARKVELWLTYFYHHKSGQARTSLLQNLKIVYQVMSRNGQKVKFLKLLVKLVLKRYG